MTAIAACYGSDVAVVDTEQRMVLHGVSWDEYVRLREAFDRPSLRLTYCEGTLELMSPSRTREVNTKTIARLVELYAFLRGFHLNGYRSTTFRKQARERGAEPDECYACEREMPEGGFPDIVLEVVHSNPLVDKLDVYRGFDVPEVWVFRKGAFELYRLAGDHYERVERSAFLPDLDFALIARLAVLPDQHEALLELQRSLAG